MADKPSARVRKVFIFFMIISWCCLIAGTFVLVNRSSMLREHIRFFLFVEGWLCLTVTAILARRKNWWLLPLLTSVWPILGSLSIIPGCGHIGFSEDIHRHMDSAAWATILLWLGWFIANALIVIRVFGKSERTDQESGSNREVG